jgi:uncharacterized iron-regulated membrane protein
LKLRPGLSAHQWALRAVSRQRFAQARTASANTRHLVAAAAADFAYHRDLDQYIGGVLAVDDPKRNGMGDTMLNRVVPIHDGKAFGMVGRVWVMLLGPGPSVMMVTGFMLWRQKRTARNKARRARDRTSAFIPSSGIRWDQGKPLKS